MLSRSDVEPNRSALDPLSVLHQSLSILDHLLTHEECDVDIQNRVQRDTPLHLAIKVEEGDGRFGLREYLGRSWSVAAHLRAGL